MGFAIPHALGLRQRTHIREEAVFGTFVPPIAANANQGEGEIRVFNFNITHTHERRDRADTRQTSRSLTERIDGRKSTEWEIGIYAMYEGTPGTNEPGYGSLLQAGTGATPSLGGGETTYALASGQAGLIPLSMTKEANSVVMESIAGAAVNTIRLEVRGGDEPKWTFSGMAKTHIKTGYTLINEGGGYTTTDTFTVDDASLLNVGSVVEIGSNQGLNSNGLKVSAVNKTTNSITVVNAEDDSAVSISGSDNDEVKPYLPADASNADDTPIAGIDGSLTVGGTTVVITGFTLEINNNIKAIDDEAFQQEMSDYIPSLRSVTGEITFRARRDQVAQWCESEEFAGATIVCTLGSGVTSRIEVTVKCELDVGTLDYGGIEEEGIFTVPYTGLSSVSAGVPQEDEVVITFK